MPRRHITKWALKFGLAILFGAAAASAAGAAGDPSAGRQQELIDLLRQDCGACHGLHLTGGLGPGLRPQDLHGKPVENLSAVILRGRPGTPMPGWQAFITESEAGWMVETLRKGLSDDH